jgi:hypothetical protein
LTLSLPFDKSKNFAKLLVIKPKPLQLSIFTKVKRAYRELIVSIPKKSLHKKVFKT